MLPYSPLEFQVERIPVGLWTENFETAIEVSRKTPLSNRLLNSGFALRCLRAQWPPTTRKQALDETRALQLSGCARGLIPC